MSHPLVATCGHPKEKHWNEFGSKEFQPTSKKLAESVVYLAINQNKLHNNPAKKRILQFIIIPSTYLYKVFRLRFKNLPLICSHLSNETCFKSSSPAMRWIKQSNSCRLPFPPKKRCHPKPSYTCISSQFPTCPCAALLLHVSPGQRTAKQRKKNGDRLTMDQLPGVCFFTTS